MSQTELDAPVQAAKKPIAKPVKKQTPKKISKP